MVNEEALEEIEKLSNIYEKTWGVPVDYTILPAGLTQEKLVVVLKRIVDTGESVLVGYAETFGPATAKFLQNKHIREG